MNAELYESDLNNYTWLAGEVDRHETPQAMALGKLLHEKLAPTSVIDVGCSSGIYLVPFMTQGVEVLGIDGASGVGAWIPGKFQVVDLRQPWSPSHKYDLCLNIEVAEHMRCEYSSLLVETLAKCSDTIFFTAARPGQGGESHLCERDKDYWLKLFSVHGIGVHPRNDEVMNVINADPVYEHCHWIVWNGMLLGKS